MAFAGAARCAASLVGSLIASLAVPAAATSWVKDEVKLNIRTGPSLEHRILATIATGDSADVLETGDGWTRVRDAQGHEGWVPEGYLQEHMPAVVKLRELERETEKLREQMQKAATESSELRQMNDELSTSAGSRQEEMDRLKEENMAYRAGARWPTLFAGASILLGGMLIGALARSAGPRRSKVRL
jgi:SH3 domain protein